MGKSKDMSCFSKLVKLSKHAVSSANRCLIMFPINFLGHMSVGNLLFYVVLVFISHASLNTGK